MTFKRQRFYKKWYKVIARVVGDLVDVMMSYTKRISYVTSDLHKRLLIKPSHLDTRLLWLK
ncbi:hypothetical protein [Candidatus Enterovibrio escicola]|uniref:hypothetical protein n=1 Tax=Candidatus Enterovibrio escicola TaxID=1927127 RepID=UPI0012380FCC|nr:hypothetical protein [Candidatus Enterovibrio escacola]